jgi:hypothetical protein
MSGSGQKYIYRKCFENSLLRSSGDEFQQLFYKLMSTKYMNFQKIETEGSIGDRKNDGYLKDEGIFFQSYGPKQYDANGSIQSAAIKKIIEDFNGLKTHVDNGYWEPIKKFVFVFATHRGTYPNLIETLKDLKDNNPLISFDIYDIDNLLRAFDQLNLDDMQIVSGTYIPEPDFSYISYTIMGDIVKKLITITTANNIDMTITPPDFADKIAFNHISNFFAINLNVASYKVPQLDDFLSSYQDTTISDNLCAIFKKLYEDAKEAKPENPDLQFKYILNHCYSESTPINQIQAIETNSYVLMAKYFETCDIFEEPKIR